MSEFKLDEKLRSCQWLPHIIEVILSIIFCAYNYAAVHHALGDPLEVLLVLVHPQVVVGAAHHDQPAPRPHPLTHVLHVVRPALRRDLNINKI